MANICAISTLKKHLADLHHRNPNVHIDINLSQPKMQLVNAPARIEGVYNNIFAISEESSGSRRMHTLRYADVLIGQINIRELQESK